MEPQSHTCLLGVGARYNEESVLVELAVRDGDQRLVAASVVPAKHALRQATGCEQAEDAFNVGNLCTLPVVFLRLRSGHLGEKCRGWQLAFVANDNDLFGSGNRAKRVHGLYLGSLVHHQQVERYSTR